MKTHNDKPDFDQSLLELIHGDIDGELTPSERLELDKLLADSEKAHVFNEELAALSSILEQVPEKEPPAYLQKAIERQVRLPAEDNRDRKRSGILTSWLVSHRAQTGFAVAAAMVLTIGVYEMSAESLTSQDTANMMGTVVKSPVVDQGVLLDSIHLRKDNFSGLIELRNKGDLYTLDIQLNSAGPSELVINFTGRGLEFAGSSQGQGRNEAVSIKNGAINVASSGEQHITLILRRTSEVVQAVPLELDFYANKELVHKAGLSVIQQ